MMRDKSADQTVVKYAIDIKYHRYSHFATPRDICSPHLNHPILRIQEMSSVHMQPSAS
jgi:hypothetical protein